MENENFRASAVVNLLAGAELLMVQRLLEEPDPTKAAQLVQEVIGSALHLVAGAAVLCEMQHGGDLNKQTNEQADARRTELNRKIQRVVLSMMSVPIKGDSDLPFEAATAFASANVERFIRHPGGNPDEAEKLCAKFTQGMISALAMCIVGPQAALCELAGGKFADSDEVAASCTEDAVGTIQAAAQQVSDKWGSFFNAKAKAAVAARPKKDSRGVE